MERYERDTRKKYHKILTLPTKITVKKTDIFDKKK